MNRRVGALTAVVAILLVALPASPAPARAGGNAVTGAEWHRLHPALCHTVGEHSRDY